jgi:TonB-linked SusC/RagA family outer membrane protein
MIFFKWCKPLQAHCVSPHRRSKFKIATTLQLLIALISFSTASAIVKAQEINLKVKEATMESVFNEIKKQTGYGFFYDKAEVTNAKITINVKNAGLKETLDQCFKDQPYSYEIFDKTIVVKRKVKSGNSQIPTPIDLTINGKVTDEKNEPLPGVTVKIKNNGKIALTDYKGEFSISVPNQDAILQFTYIGYASVEQVIGKSSYLTIVLKEEANTLQSVEVNAGYYTVKERERTGSISKVTAETIGKQPISNPLQALQGTVAGVVVTQTTGVAGGGFSVRIRGQNSISSGSDPLYVIDGINYPSSKLSASAINDGILSSAGASPMSLINPEDIESIAILRDADATAIYGSRGSNGVVLITTKKGQTGSSQITANFTQGFSQVANRIELLNTEQYIEMRKEAFKNDGLVPAANQFDVNGIWSQTKYTDWQEELIGGTANTTNASLNIRGGNNKHNYLLGGSYYKEGTVFPGEFGFKRGTVHVSLNLGSPSERFSASITSTYSNIKNNLFTSDLTSLIFLSPNAPDMYDEFGKINWSDNTVYVNPMAHQLRTNDSSTDNLLANVNLRYNLSKNLYVKVSLGYNDIKRTELVLTPLSGLSPAFGFNSTNRISNFVNNFTNNWTAEPQIIYNNKMGKGVFEALIGSTLQENNSEYRTVRGTGFNSDELMRSMSSAANLSTYQLDNVRYKYTAIFTRVNYSLSNKYYFNLTGRHDGSSRFSKENQFANFGAVGAAWIFSEEEAVQKNLSFLSFGKLRASYGITGNDQIPEYGYLQLWNTGNTYQGSTTITPNRLGNPNYRWETNKKAEIAIQLRFIKDKLGLEASYYRNRSSNQLVGLALPPSTGFQTIQANLPADLQNTGWEFETDFHVLNKVNWQWNIGLNLTIPSNKLLAYPNLESSTNAFLYEVGKPLTIRKGYDVSVNPQTGVYTFKDVDGNGSRNDLDRYIIDFLGPKYYGGLQNAIRFKQISFSLLLAFTKQNGLNYLATTPSVPGQWVPNSPTGNQPIEVLKRWQKIGDETSIQRFGTGSITSSSNQDVKLKSSKAISDASFIRVKNVALNYSLPKRWISAMKISSAEINLQGQNLFTLTNYIGLDPETQSMSNLPPLRTITMGLKFTL